jgi:hypothetical protein
MAYQPIRGTRSIGISRASLAAANDVCAVRRRMLRPPSDAAATSREGHRLPGLGRAGQHRRWGPAQQQRAFRIATMPPVVNVPFSGLGVSAVIENGMGLVPSKDLALVADLELEGAWRVEYFDSDGAGYFIQRARCCNLQRGRE